MNPAEELPPDVAHRAYYRQPVWKRIVVIGAGPAVNIVLAFVILWVLFWANGTVEATNRIDRVAQDAPATGVLRPGDRLVAVDEVTGDPEVLREQIATHTCAEDPPVARCRATEPARVTVLRDGERRTFEITPAYDTRAQRPLLGFEFDRIRREAGPVRAASVSLDSMWRFTSLTVTTIAQIFRPEVRDDISGVVGSYEVTRQTIEVSATGAVFLLAIISLSLGVINLFPFLPLDGGHIFWAVAEKLRGRAISFQTMERAGFVGFVLVIGLFVIGFTNDIGRLTGEGFGVR
jgi:regulator of sigma E protease